MFKISDPCCFTTMQINPNIILLFFFSWYNTCFQSCLASHKGLCVELYFTSLNFTICRSQKARMTLLLKCVKPQRQFERMFSDVKKKTGYLEILVTE